MTKSLSKLARIARAYRKTLADVTAYAGKTVDPPNRSGSDRYGTNVFA